MKIDEPTAYSASEAAGSSHGAAESEPSSANPGRVSAPARPSAARSTLWILATRVISLPLGFLVAWMLGPLGQGEFTFLSLFGSLVLPMATLGFGGSIIYYISSGKYAARDVLPTSLFVGLLQGFANAALVGLLWRFGWLGETAAAIPASLMIPTLLVLPVQGAILMLTRVLLGDSCFALNNWVTLATPLVNSVALLIFVVALKLEVAGAVAAVVVTNLIVALYLVWGSWRRYRPELALNGPFLREGFRYGLKIWPTDVAVRANLRLDQFLLGVLAPGNVLGLYSVAVKISEMLWMLPDSLAFVLFNRIAGEKDSEHRIALTSRIHRILFFAVGLSSLAAGLLGYWLLPILMPKYAGSALPLLLLIPGTVCFTTTKVISKYFAANGAPGRSSITAVAGAVVGVTLYFIMVPLFKIEGAAISSSASYLTMSIAAIWLYRNMIAPAPVRLFGLKRADICWAIDLLHAALPARLRRAAP